MTIIHGVVRGHVVVLPDDVALPDGLAVEVRPLEQPEQQATAAAAEERFKQRLVELGILKRVRKPAALPSDVDRTPIEVGGKPLSELIIEERR